VIQLLLGITFAISMVTAIVSSMGAHFTADYLKRNGEASASTPDYAHSAPPPFLDVGISLADLFSSLHTRYKHRFLTGCVYVARIAFISSGILLAALGVAFAFS
jgi:hypothetical protein